MTTKQHKGYIKPLTPNQQIIARFIASNPHCVNQSLMLKAIQASGHNKISQSTISRAVEILVDREQSSDGYRLKPEYQAKFGEDPLIRDLERSFVNVYDPAHNLLVKTKPGLSHLVATSLKDHYRDAILGTICDNDTVLVFAANSDCKEKILALLKCHTPLTK